MSKKGNGEGTIYYSEKLNKWIGQFVIGRKDNGKLRQAPTFCLFSSFLVFSHKCLKINVFSLKQNMCFLSFLFVFRNFLLALH